MIQRRWHFLHQVDAAVAPIATNPELRKKLVDVRRSFEQTIDVTSIDQVIETGHSKDATDRARNLVDSFHDYIEENKNEITALQVLSAWREDGRPLSELAAGLPRVPQVLHNVKVRERRPLDQIDGHPELVEAWMARLGDQGRLLVRYSGTEPLVRVMVEGSDQALVLTCAEELAGHLERRLGLEQQGAS